MPEMYNITVFPRTVADKIVLQYSDVAKADGARLLIEHALRADAFAEVEDDYGAKAYFRGGDYSGAVMVHLARHLDGQRAGTLLQEIAKLKFSQDMAADPTIKLLQSGPGFRGNPQMG